MDLPIRCFANSILAKSILFENTQDTSSNQRIAVWRECLRFAAGLFLVTV